MWNGGVCFLKSALNEHKATILEIESECILLAVYILFTSLVFLGLVCSSNGSAVWSSGWLFLNLSYANT